jgi:type II secretory pathway predicted ATPase ExeA
MFVNYYNLLEQPFGVTPNPRYLYLTPTHREAMASIVYGVMENRGFTALIAPPGMGKTTLLFDLLRWCGETMRMRTVFLFQFQPTPEGLLRNLLAELGIADDGQNFAGMQEKLNQAILQEAKEGRRIVVVVDEAQNFREPVLEVLRMLSNFETSQEKLIHIILSGQLQLAEMLTSQSIEQLRQRISIIAVLQPLDAKQTREYIEHRLRVAGYKSTRPLFNEAACNMIAEYSGGIPRTINNLCFNSLSLGCALRRATIGRDIVIEVYRDLDLDLAPGPAAPAKTRSGTFPARPSFAQPAIPYAPRRTTGRGFRFTASVASFAAALCIGGVFADQYLNSSGVNRAALPAPRPPAPQVEATPQTPVADTAVNSDQTALPASTGDEPMATREDVSAAPQKAQRVKLVTVSRPETLYGLCLENMGHCDTKTLREIREMNPWLDDPKQLRAGQKVRMPLERGGDLGPTVKNRKDSQATANSGEKR